MQFSRSLFTKKEKSQICRRLHPLPGRQRVKSHRPGTQKLCSHTLQLNVHWRANPSRQVMSHCPTSGIHGHLTLSSVWERRFAFFPVAHVSLFDISAFLLLCSRFAWHELKKKKEKKENNRKFRETREVRTGHRTGQRNRRDVKILTDLSVQNRTRRHSFSIRSSTRGRGWGFFHIIRTGMKTHRRIFELEREGRGEKEKKHTIDMNANENKEKKSIFWLCLPAWSKNCMTLLL